MPNKDAFSVNLQHRFENEVRKIYKDCYSIDDLVSKLIEFRGLEQVKLYNTALKLCDDDFNKKLAEALERIHLIWYNLISLANQSNNYDKFISKLSFIQKNELIIFKHDPNTFRFVDCFSNKNLISEVLGERKKYIEYLNEKKGDSNQIIEALKDMSSLKTNSHEALFIKNNFEPLYNEIYHSHELKENKIC